MPCPELKPEEIATLAKIPTLVMFGDHLSDVQGGIANLAGIVRQLQEVRAAGEGQREATPR